MNSGKLAFGALLLVIGALLLAIRIGFAPSDSLTNLLPYWPVLLIAFGLAFLAGAIKNAALGCFAALLILGAVVFGVVWTSKQHAKNQVSHGVSALDLAKANVQTLTVRMHTFAGSLAIVGVPPKRRTITIEVRKVAPKAGSGFRFAAAGKAGEFEWPERRGALGLAPAGAEVRLEIPEALPVSFDCRAQLSSTRADLRRLKLRRCEFKQVASSLQLELGDGVRPEDLRIRGFLSTVRIRIAAGLPVRLVIGSPFTMHSLPSDFMEHARGRGKERVFTSDGRGPPVKIFAEGPLLNIKIERAPLREI